MNKYIILVLSFTISLFCLANDSISLHSSVLLKNNNNLIPLRNLNHLKIASLNLAANSSNTLEKICFNEGLEPVFFNLSEYMKSGAMLSCMMMHLNYVDQTKSLI